MVRNDLKAMARKGNGEIKKRILEYNGRFNIFLYTCMTFFNDFLYRKDTKTYERCIRALLKGCREYIVPDEEYQADRDLQKVTKRLREAVANQEGNLPAPEKHACERCKPRDAARFELTSDPKPEQHVRAEGHKEEMTLKKKPAEQVKTGERRKWVTRCTCKVCGETSEQEPTEFSSIIFPKINPKNLGKVARSYHFECYCKENDLVDVECVKCGADMGVGKRHRTDGKDYICSECWEKKHCLTCGKEFARWMLDENGRCRKCAAGKVKVKCNECGCLIPKWVYERNKGRCDDCLKGVATYCAHCGAYIGKRQPRSDGKKQYCDECWKSAKCVDCGWDNNGKMKKWMFDESGRCGRCAAKSTTTASSTVRRTTVAAKPIQQEPPKPVKKKSFFERLFE